MFRARARSICCAAIYYPLHQWRVVGVGAGPSSSPQARLGVRQPSLSVGKEQPSGPPQGSGWFRDPQFPLSEIHYVDMLIATGALIPSPLAS